MWRNARGSYALIRSLDCCVFISHGHRNTPRVLLQNQSIWGLACSPCCLLENIQEVPLLTSLHVFLAYNIFIFFKPPDQHHPMMFWTNELHLSMSDPKDPYNKKSYSRQWSSACWCCAYLLLWQWSWWRRALASLRFSPFLLAPCEWWAVNGCDIVWLSLSCGWKIIFASLLEGIGNFLIALVTKFSCHTVSNLLWSCKMLMGTMMHMTDIVMLYAILWLYSYW